MKRVLILSGPTHEYIDPVRFIGNASSGKMGRALAEEARSRGMEVAFISGPVPAEHLPDLAAPVVRVRSAEEMLAAGKEHFAAADLILFAAAVADFQPLEKADKKISKSGTGLSLLLRATPDIAATLCAQKRSDQTAIGFALQTHDGEARARKKRAAKHLDAIVLNTPDSLGADRGVFTWLDARTTEPWGLLDKTTCARRILERAAC